MRSSGHSRRRRVAGGRHWTHRTVSSNVLSEGCLPGRQPPAEAENSPKDFQSNAKMIDLDALVAGLELG